MFFHQKVDIENEAKKSAKWHPSDSYFSGSYFSGSYFSASYFSASYFSASYFSGSYFSGPTIPDIFRGSE
ncbi:MAG: pentapeptide repeat-containing protein [Deltaproteobacteria bacterium]|nr:pentapeptide repeat-containing protein [Deltaproteobacteria bacterium]